MPEHRHIGEHYRTFVAGKPLTRGKRRFIGEVGNQLLSIGARGGQKIGVTLPAGAGERADSKTVDIGEGETRDIRRQLRVLRGGATGPIEHCLNFLRIANAKRFLIP